VCLVPYLVKTVCADTALRGELSRIRIIGKRISNLREAELGRVAVLLLVVGGAIYGPACAMTSGDNINIEGLLCGPRGRFDFPAAAQRLCERDEIRGDRAVAEASWSWAL